MSNSLALLKFQFPIMLIFKERGNFSTRHYMRLPKFPIIFNLFTFKTLKRPEKIYFLKPKETETKQTDKNHLLLQHRSPAKNNSDLSIELRTFFTSGFKYEKKTHLCIQMP